MADKVADKIADKTIKKAKGEGDRKDGGCPWCAHEDKEYVNENYPKGKMKQDSTLLEISGIGFQCLTCGKTWQKDSIGKPWSLELERGKSWEREARARELRGS